MHFWILFNCTLGLFFLVSFMGLDNKALKKYIYWFVSFCKGMKL